MDNKTNVSTENTAPAVSKKRILHNALRFYSILLGVVLAVLILLCCLMLPLNTLLEQYETSRPKYLAAEVYDMLFADPDWTVLYNLADVEGTEFEGRSEYVAYMTDKVGNHALNYTEVSDGLSGDKRYSVRLGTEEIAAFTLSNYDDGISTFPCWTLDSVEVFFTREQAVTVTVLPGHTVYINGVALDESYITMAVTTAAEEHLPDGLHGYRYIQQQVTGLLVQPEIVVLDGNGETVPLSRGASPGNYTVAIPTTEAITDDEISLVQKAIRAEALFSIRAISAGQLRQTFAPSGQAYASLCDADALASHYIDYEFDDASVVVEDYYRYDSDTFSVRACGTLYVTDNKGVTRNYTISTSYLFTQNQAGTYLVTDRIEDDLQRLVTAVRLIYSNGNDILMSALAETTGTVNAPDFQNDSGSKPTGWAKMGADGTLTTVLALQDDGTYSWVAGVTQEPMTVYPVFE